MPRPKLDKPTYTLVKRGNLYSVQFWDDGAAKRVPCRTADEEEAKQFLAAFIAGRAAEPVPNAPTLGKILDGYALDRVPLDEDPRIHAPATLLYAINNLKRHLAYLPADLFTKIQARQYCADRRKEPPRGRSGPYRRQSLSDGTLHRELGVLRAALAWAVREGWIVSAPFVERPASSPARERWLTTEEAGLLFGACTHEYQRRFLAIALYTGARSSAILELTWDCVDFNRKTIDFGLPNGKKRRPRNQPMVPALYDLLSEAKTSAKSPFVIGDRAAIGSIKRGFKAVAQRAGLPDVTAHILRHTAVTWMMQDGVPTTEIAGYAAMSEATVNRIYGHHSPDYMSNAVSALARRLPAINRQAANVLPFVKKTGQHAALTRLRGVSSPSGEEMPSYFPAMTDLSD